MEIGRKSVLDDMTDEQRKILKEFRESLGVELNHRHTDEYLVKYLRAKNYNINETKKIFLENYYNRITFGVNNILETYQKPEVAEKYETTGFLGFAKDGTLIRYMAVGRLDFYGFLMSMTLHDLCLYFSYFMENDIQALEDESLKTGKNLTEITYVLDLEGFTLQQVLHQNVVEVGLDYVRLLQDCYPELWRNAIVVNREAQDYYRIYSDRISVYTDGSDTCNGTAPKVFHAAFNIFKPVLRQALREKLHIVDKAHTKAVLLKYIDEDILPAFLGGKRVDCNGDPMCKEFITFGGPVPEKFYLQNILTLLSTEDPEVRHVTLGARSMFNASIAIREAGTKLRIQARTENGSIYICIFYREFAPDADHTELPGDFENLEENAAYKQISVELRDQMHCTPEDAVMHTLWPGIYVVRLNNTGSWFTSKKLYYKCTLYPPKPLKSSS